MERSKIKTPVWVVEKGKILSRSDQLATEEPLEIRLVYPQRTVAVTRRSPGADFELTAGFLYNEGIVTQRDDIQRLSYCVEGEQRYNIVNVQLRDRLNPSLQILERHFYTNSACGVCGKASLEQLRLRGNKITSQIQVTTETIYRLSDRLRSSQKIFSSTGGLHAAALFDTTGELLSLQEDIGRHNALDKLIGSAFLSQQLPLNDRILLLSGLASFELLQKSLAAEIPIVCAVSAPSSLAVQVAREFGITLIGFLRGEHFNIYSGIERIINSL